MFCLKPTNEATISQDPRQYVPATGQVFTTLGKLKSQGFKNVWWQDKYNSNIWFVKTEPGVREMPPLQVIER